MRFYRRPTICTTWAHLTRNSTIFIRIVCTSTIRRSLSLTPSLEKTWKCRSTSRTARSFILIRMSIMSSTQSRRCKPRQEIRTKSIPSICRFCRCDSSVCTFLGQAISKTCSPPFLKMCRLTRSLQACYITTRSPPTRVEDIRWLWARGPSIHWSIFRSMWGRGFMWNKCGMQAI